MILTVIPIDKYNLFRDCDFVNSLENKKIHKQKKFHTFKMLPKYSVPMTRRFHWMKLVENIGEKILF